MWEKIDVLKAIVIFIYKRLSCENVKQYDSLFEKIPENFTSLKTAGSPFGCVICGSQVIKFCFHVVPSRSRIKLIRDRFIFSYVFLSLNL